jgi:hypothetical protein
MSNVVAMDASRSRENMSSNLDGGVSSHRIFTCQINTNQIEIL